jgi:hypothetical protein
MAKFTLQFIPENIVLKDFIEKTKERAKTNPFIMFIERIKEGVYSFDITPVYPRIYWLGLVLYIAIPLLYFLLKIKGIFPFIIFCVLWLFSCCLLLSFYLWTKYPYMIALKKGLHKVDYFGSIKEVLKSDK